MAFPNYGYYGFQPGYPAYSFPNSNPYLNAPPVMPQQVQQTAPPSTPQPTQPTPQTTQQAQPDTIVNGGFVVVPTEEDVKRYAVAPGNCVTFKLENQPVIIEKSLGRSQFDSPHYERYKLVKENMPEETAPGDKEAPATDPSENALRDEIGALKSDVENIQSKIEKLKNKVSDALKRLKAVEDRPTAKLNNDDEEDTEDEDI